MHSQFCLTREHIQLQSHFKLKMRRSKRFMGLNTYPLDKDNFETAVLIIPIHCMMSIGYKFWYSGWPFSPRDLLFYDQKNDALSSAVKTWMVTRSMICIPLFFFLLTESCKAF